MPQWKRLKRGKKKTSGKWVLVCKQPDLFPRKYRECKTMEKQGVKLEG